MATSDVEEEIDPPSPRTRDCNRSIVDRSIETHDCTHNDEAVMSCA
jgi:hypothetical protein